MVVSMVGAGIIKDVRSAIPIIMGSNIGTCVTNAFVALTLAGEPGEFKRAFSAAALNDMFNFLTTFVLLILEISFDNLNFISGKLTDMIPFENASLLAQANFVSKLINPLCDLFIQLDPIAVNELAMGKEVYKVALRCCDLDTSNSTIEVTNNSSHNASDVNVEVCARQCSYWLMPMLSILGDGGIGIIFLIDFKILT